MRVTRTFRACLFAALCCLVALAGGAWGQCPGGACGVPPAGHYGGYGGYGVPYHPAPVFHFPQAIHHPPVYHPAPVIHHPVVSPAVVRPAEPETPAPAPEEKPKEKDKPAEAEAPRNFGVDTSKLGGGPRYVLNGREVSRERAIEAIRDADADGVPDDSAKFHLVLIGSEPDRRAVSSALDLGANRDRVVVHSYPADSPLVAQRKLVTGGTPTVYLLSPKGHVLGRNLDGKAPAAAALRDAVARLVSSFDPSRALPSSTYDPARDPELVEAPKFPPAPPAPPAPPKPDDKPGPTPAPDKTAGPPTWLTGLGWVAALLLLFKRQQQ